MAEAEFLALELRERHPNRRKVKAPKRVKVWCSGCDRQVVQPGRKCPTCGHREYSKRLRT